MEFEDFHIVAVKATSDRIAELLIHGGIRIQQRVIMEIGRPEYVIALHRDDLAQAEKLLRDDIGPARTITSNET